MDLVARRSPAGEAKRVITLEEALMREMVTLPEECTSQEEAAYRTARDTAKKLAMLIAKLYAYGNLGKDDIAELVPDHDVYHAPE